MNKLALASVVLFSVLYACGGKEGPMGPPGVAGPQGVPGVAGDAGINGTDNHLTSHLWCSAVVSPVQVTFGLDTFASGDLFVTCGVRDTNSYTEAAWFYSGHTAFASAPTCNVYKDIDGTDTQGVWNFAKNPDGGTDVLAVYNDPGSPNHGSGAHMTAPDGGCTQYNY